MSFSRWSVQDPQFRQAFTGDAGWAETDVSLFEVIGTVHVQLCACPPGTVKRRELEQSKSKIPEQ